MDQRVLQTSRIVIGLAQGILLYWLHWSFNAHVWPATNGYVFAPLLAAGFFLPLIAVSGLGNLRTRTLCIWLAVAAMLCGLLAIYDIYRMPALSTPLLNMPNATLRVTPSASLAICLAALLFIADNLVVAADADRRLFARYPTLFEASWKHGIQAFLAQLFTSILWAILFLGAALFALIKITLIERTIREPLFWIPVTAVSFAYALHIADVRATIVRGTRTLVLVLFSWLLPVMTLLAIGFILSLPFTGLDALWSTKRAASILLSSAGALVFLINAVYRDGEDDNAVILRYCRSAAAIVVVPIVALAGYALMLRVVQYGWTPERVIVAALVTVATCYAIGYAAAAIGSGLSLRWLEPVNVFTTFIIIALFLALMTPVADPARISVNSQLARLQSGIVTPEKFDYAFLRLKAGRYGSDALEALANHTYGPGAAVYAERVRSGRPTGLPVVAPLPAPLPSVDKILANITVIYPKGASFPSSFLERDWAADPRRFALPRCMTADAKCHAVLIDLDGDGKEEILLFTINGTGVPGAVTTVSGVAFKQQDDKSWRQEGVISNTFCRGFSDALGKGEVESAAPKYKDIVVGGQRASINPGCPPVVAPTAPKTN
jgi:hypothetical protein